MSRKRVTTLVVALNTLTIILIISIIIADVVAVAATVIQTYEVELPILEVIEFRLSQIPCFV